MKYIIGIYIDNFKGNSKLIPAIWLIAYIIYIFHHHPRIVNSFVEGGKIRFKYFKDLLYIYKNN